MSCEIRASYLADEGKGLPPDPLGTVAEPDGEFVDEVQAQIIGPTCIQLLEDLYHLRTQEVTKHIKTGYTKAVHWQRKAHL